MNCLISLKIFHAQQLSVPLGKYLNKYLLLYYICSKVKFFVLLKLFHLMVLTHTHTHSHTHTLLPCQNRIFKEEILDVSKAEKGVRLCYKTQSTSKKKVHLALECLFLKLKELDHPPNWIPSKWQLSGNSAGAASASVLLTADQGQHSCREKACF